MNEPKDKHPLYPETFIEHCCPTCQSTEVYEVRGRFYCAACEQRAEAELKKQNVDFEIKEAKYRQSSSVYAASWKPRDYWYD